MLYTSKGFASCQQNNKKTIKDIYSPRDTTESKHPQAGDTPSTLTCNFNQ